MRRLLGSLFAVLVLFGAASASAQYTVKSESETLWGIAAKNLDAATAWETIYNANAFLHEPGRRYVDHSSGLTIVVIHAGEVLQGVNEAGIVQPPPPPPPPPTLKPAAPKSKPIPPVAKEKEASWFWLWVLLFIAALVALGVWLYRRPPTWRPVVQGGVADDAQASRLLQESAQARNASLIRGSEERVRMYGVWATKHRGVPIPIPHRYDGARAWRARFRMPNGTERSGFMLQGCGNDVVLGGAWYLPLHGARVEEGWGDTAATTTTTAPPPPPPVQALPPPPVPAPLPVAAVPPVTEETTRTFVSFTQASGNGPNMIRWHGVNAPSFEVEADGTRVLRFR
jgi:hypothetical protein